MDASQHVWFGSTKTHLHTAIDDATGMIVAGWFDTQETRNGYYQITKQFLSQFASCQGVQSCWVAITQEQIAQALVTFAKRTVDMGNGIRLGGKYYGTFGRYGNQVFIKPKTKVTVITMMNHSVYAMHNDTLLAMDIIPER